LTTVDFDFDDGGDDDDDDDDDEVSDVTLHHIVSAESSRRPVCVRVIQYCTVQ
jgi:hypothetical protein